MTDRLKIVFMGTPDFAVPALKEIYESGHYDVVAVFSQPPRPSGRGQKITRSPVHDYADDKDIPVYTPLSLRKEEDQKEFLALNADVAVVAAYGLILPRPILDAPKYGCINIHASILPRWRGASPIQRAIWAGDTESGVTIMKMEEGLDTGPMISKKSVPITDDMTAQDLHDDLSELGGKLILPVLDTLARDEELDMEVQDETLSTYAKMLKKEDGLIDWSRPAIEIDRQIRALNPWPGTYTNIRVRDTEHEEEVTIAIKVLYVELSDEIHTQEPGEILDKKGHVACGNNTVLKLTMLKPQNSNIMDFSSAFNGGYVHVGEILK